MNRTMKIRSSASKMRLTLLIALLATATVMTPMAWGQAPARFIGTVTSISGTTLTVKTDAGQSYQVEVPSGAAIKRIEPGEKDLTKAATMRFSDLAVGDRTLVKLDPD